jgi:DNA (cytosine-5)-methyltransferase 1
MGYYRAGFTDITGIDNCLMPRYPFSFIQTDALKYLAEHGHEYDVIHASPPCQAYMDTNSNGKKPSRHPRLIEPIREILVGLGKPYIIENVHKAPLKANLMLCGTMFGLRVLRHRYFECSFFPGLTLSCNHWGQVADGDFIGVYAFGGRGHRHGRGRRDGPPLPPRVTTSEAMGIDWMTNRELRQAIPPAYTEFIGLQLMTRLEQAS